MLPQAWGLGTLGWFGLLPIVLALLAIIGIVAAIIFALRQSASRKRTIMNSSLPEDGTEAVLSAREILQIRYVCGEINRDQYYEILADLN